MDVGERLRALEVSVSELSRSVRERTETLEELLKRHDHVLMGNGEPGLRMEVDRLKQVETSRTWHARAIWTAMLGLVLKAAHDLFRGGPHP